MKEIIKKRMTYFFKLAKENAKEHEERAIRYVKLAKKLSTRYRVAIPKEFKRSFCKKCYRFWIPGFNLRTRVKKNCLEYNCSCGEIRRFGR